jgi:hypothetical protein
LTCALRGRIVPLECWRGGRVEAEDLYELVVDAVRQALADEAGGGEIRISKRLVDARVVFLDADDRVLKELTANVVFKKLTAIREKLRVMEQRINNHEGLSEEDRVELQAYLTRCYGSLTTFNFMFRDEADRFKGTGG